MRLSPPAFMIGKALAALNSLSDVKVGLPSSGHVNASTLALIVASGKSDFPVISVTVNWKPPRKLHFSGWSSFIFFNVFSRLSFENSVSPATTSHASFGVKPLCFLNHSSSRAYFRRIGHDTERCMQTRRCRRSALVEPPHWQRDCNLWPCRGPQARFSQFSFGGLLKGVVQFL